MRAIGPFSWIMAKDHGFSTELNGKYREGSIDERWKAIRAYSQIVGKRIDPAILQMDYQGSLQFAHIPDCRTRQPENKIHHQPDDDA
ncbi:MAG: hypothetical protein IPI66_07195 [Chitinophagaceae bacterium]|nr:hypothetical protein [Chitinophagaceae bacterium]